jgi:L-threonylcarbamoyladenylate synthase
VKSQKLQIKQAIKALQQGGVIAYPTEAVYGLGCDPGNISAIKKILALKQREKAKGLILVAANFDQLKPYLQSLNKNIEDKILASWRHDSKPVTWLIPAKESVSVYLKGQFDTLAVRVSHHPVVKELCLAFSGAIVSTSANYANQAAARTADEVKNIFDNKLDVIVDGETNHQSSPSEIRDALTDKIIRTA